MTTIIGRVALQPAIVRPGEPVGVEVFDTNDNSFSLSTTEIYINGVPGALQFLQFPTVGQRRIIVRAQTPEGESDQQVALLDVAGAPLEFPSLENQKDIAMIGVTQSATQAYTAVLTLGSVIDTRSPHPLHYGPAATPGIRKPFAKKSVAARLASRGVLGRAMLENPRKLVQIESRPLTKTRIKAVAKSESGTRTKPKVSTRRAVAAIYDLSTVDLTGIFQKAVTAPPLEFEWDFGDGNVATTRSPTVVHDYFAAMDHSAGASQFVVTCNIKHAGITVRRSLTVYSAYAICKRSGTIVPHVTSDLFAHKQYTMMTGQFTVHNVEDQAMVLDRVSITALNDDGDSASLPRPYISLGQHITIPARSASMIGVNVPFVTGMPKAGELKYDIPGFTVLYAGTAGTTPVRCSATFDIPVPERTKQPKAPTLPDVPDLGRKPWPWEIVEDSIDSVINPAEALGNPGETFLDTKTGTLAVSLGQINVTGSKAEIRNGGVKVLSAGFASIEARVMEARRIARPAARHLSSNLHAGNFRQVAPKFTAALTPTLKPAGHDSPVFFMLDGPPLPGFIAEGQVCDPDNLTEEDLAAADAGQLVCQLTTEVKDVLMPARWMNARKGDCILSPGGDGIIGGLMLNVEPPQWYSHSGIMTRNYDEITHSTGSQKRLMDHLIGFTADGSDGFEPSVLKYIWPGAITQTIQHSIEGEDFPDPEYDKTYSISAFGPHQVGVTHNDQMKMIPPLVLKPDPMQETPAVRVALHNIATSARAAAGRPGVKPKYHYRWYCYTDPTIGQGAPEGSGAGWAEGTHPSVCSSYIWMHAKAKGAHLEATQALVTPTDLESTDVAAGAAVRPTTPDGLYNYSATERSNAAQWLYDTIYNQAFEKAGWFGELLTDGADDIANQFLNAFANDDADGKDSDAWKTVVDADAVSPDNMLWWDPPSLGGLYGFAEPAIYREPRVESYTISRWKKVLSRGAVRGTVYGESGSVAGAFLQVFDGKTAFTDGGGHYVLNDVPLGRCLLKSSKVIDAILYSAQVNIDLNVADLTVDIYLQPPDDRYRLAQIFIDFWGRDYETFGDNEIKDPGPEYFELELGPDKLINTAGRTYKWGGEVRVVYTITVRLLVNNTIDVQVQGTLFEGTHEDTDEFGGTGGLTFQAAVGATTGATLTITNTEEDDDDAGVLSISVKNVRNNN